MLSFDKIVHKMWNKWWKILFKQDIFEIIDPECKKKYASQVDKVVYQLKARGVILSIKAGVYIVPDQEDKQLNEVDLLEKYYVRLLKKYIIHHVWAEYFISGTKSLEFHLKNFSIPERIYIVTRWLNKKVVVGNYEIVFKTISWKYQWKKINLFSKLCNFSKTIHVDDVMLKTSCLELALVESALVSDVEGWLQFDILNKAIKKYGKVFDTDIFYEIGKYKYAMSFNRLKEISRSINIELYEVFLDIIKRNGNLFIGEGLRGF